MFRRVCSALALALLGAGCSAWQEPSPPADELHADLEDGPDGRVLVFRVGAARQPSLELACAGIELTLVEGDVPTQLLIPFTGLRREGAGLVLDCGPGHAEHSLRATLRVRGFEAWVEVVDELGLPSRVAELSVAYRLRAPRGDVETFVPGAPGRGEIAGDSTWRTPVAFVRVGSTALALHPEIGGPRHLPAALELDAEAPHPVLRHGLMTQTTAVDGEVRSCRREPAAAPLLVGQTLRVAHRLVVIPAAAARRTLAGVMRDVFENRGDATTAIPPATPGLGQRAEATLLAHSARPAGLDRWLPTPTALPPDAEATFPFGPRTNLAHLALACSVLARESRAIDAARSWLRLALDAPHRAGLTPNAARFGPAGLAWPPVGTYDATAIAWTRACMLRLARRLADDDPLRHEVMVRAGQTVAFLLDSQRPDGAIPARYDGTYLAPDQSSLFDPAPESGAAALLLAEWTSFGREPRARALVAARAALEHLMRDVLPAGGWQDSEVIASGRAGHGTLGLTFAALAAIRLHEVASEPSSLAAAVEFLDLLARHQQTWSPPWLAPDPRVASLTGGVGRHESAARWLDPATALAGWAFLVGYEHTRRPDYLERGALAIRAAMLAAVARPEQGPPDPFGDAGVAAAVFALARDRFGAILVDLAAQRCVALDSMDRPTVRVQGSALALTLQRPGARPTLERVRFFGLPDDLPAYTLEVNGDSLGLFSAADLLAGIDVEVKPRPDAAFAPPAMLQDDLPWEPRVVLHSPPPPGWTGEVALWAEGADPTSPPLWRARLQPPPTERGAWRTNEPVECIALRRAGNTFTARARLRGPGGERLDLLATNTIVLGRATEWDLGSVDATDCTEPGDSHVVATAGRGLAREVLPGRHGFAWRVALAPTSSEVELELDLSGPFQLSAGGSVLAEEGGGEVRPNRSIGVRVADRRLWESGFLDLRLSHPGGDEPLRVGALRVRTRGFASGAPAADAQVRTRQPARRLDLTVVPVSFADAPLVATREQLQAAFFGEGYLRTPQPQARATAGSVRALVAAMSGGRTQVEGEVLAPLQLDALAADVRRNPETLRGLVAPAVADFRADGTRVLVVVHGGASLGPQDDGFVSAAKEPPLAAMPDLAADHSLLPVGRALAQVLVARFGLPRRTTSATGNLGALALTAHGDGHLPTGPLGLDLVALGWADLVDLAPARSQMLVTGPVQRDRRMYRLLPGVPGRGELFLEGRGGWSGEPGLPDSGLLLYWRFAQPPLVAAADGRVARPALLRLSPGRGCIDGTFVPGATEDLVRRAISFDDRGAPSFATPEGELFFRISQLAPGNDQSGEADTFGMSVEDLSHRLTASEPNVSVVPPNSVRTAMAADGLERGLGHVVWQPRMLRFETAGAALRTSWPMPPAGGRTMRAFVAVGLSGRGAPRVTFGSDEADLARTILSGGARQATFAVDLPRDAATVWLDVQPDAAQPRCTVRVEFVLLVPRARADHVALRVGETSAQKLMDGVVHAPVVTVTTGRNARGQHVEPVVVPAGRSILRLVAGLGTDAPPDTKAVVRVRLRSVDGRSWNDMILRDHVLERGIGNRPLLVALLEIPMSDHDRTGLLDIEVDAVPGTSLHLVTAEVTRP